MRALEAEVVDAVWSTVAELVPDRPSDHPLGCHRRRVPNEVCFRGILVRLVTGCSWIVTEALLGGAVSDTTLRARRDEWIAAGVFDRLVAQALAGYDRIIGLDCAHAAGDASQHKAPVGGVDTGPNYWDRGKQGWKWSLITDAAGIPIGWTTGPANRPDAALLAATLDDVTHRGLLDEIDQLHLDAGYHWAPVPPTRPAPVCWPPPPTAPPPRAPRKETTPPPPAPASPGPPALPAPPPRALIPTPPPRRTRSQTGHGRFAKGRRRQHYRPVAHRPDRHRWPIERTNSWLANFGQLRRNTDRTRHHREAQLALAITLILVAKLIDWRDRWS